MSEEETQLQSFTIDQAAGALALSLGALGSLLLVIWQSRCLCRCRIGCSDTCYIFDCQRQPPPDEENPDDKKKDKKKDKKDKVGSPNDDKPTASGFPDPPQTDQTDESIIPLSSKDSNITATITDS